MDNIIITTAKELETFFKKVLKDQESKEGKYNQSNDLPEILTIDEACKVVFLSKPTLYGLTSNKKIPHFKRGKKLYFKRSQLIEWIEKGRKGKI